MCDHDTRGNPARRILGRGKDGTCRDTNSPTIETEDEQMPWGTWINEYFTHTVRVDGRDDLKVGPGERRAHVRDSRDMRGSVIVT